ncbi:condensation domain-containing protein, partial [Pseudomonas sp. RIT-PI-S]|uniref:condensation domain-containing protein n=1 Tax=Pseudomonas sp. RIT-PI-S TaxID=3035295 RepID=UPI0021DB6436
PIANLACYVLDAHLEPVPIGVLGELYLGGAGLARGYHRRPALSAERFVASPFTAGQRLYRTGDLARYRADGVIEYAGRVDHQIKLRGLRIELGEIEARLLEHGNVREAAVLAVDGKQLVGYVVLASEPDGWQGELATHLAAQLPDYMVPAQWLALAAMPLSPNGKLERRALPRPAAQAEQAHYQAPHNEAEQALAGIWQALLGVEQVGLGDNFFALGGDSIISIQLVSRARQAGWQLSPRDVFQYQSLGALAQAAKAVAHSVIDQSPVTGETPLLPFQRQFFEQAIPNRQHWNQSVLLQPREPLNAEALEAAVAALLAHHDALRLRFSAGQGGCRAAHAAPSGQAVLWQRGAATTDELLALCEAAQRSLNLNEGPLLRAMLVSLADGTQRLLLVVHHLVVDGVSWRILLEDLHSAYSAAVNGREAALPAKTSAFKTWAERLGAYALSDSLAAEQAFWQAHLAGEAVDLPCLDASLEPTQGEAVRVQTRLDRATTQALLGQAGQAYRTQVNDLLLTALARVICRWSNTASLRVQLEGHGREDLFEGVDLSRTVGWFTSLYPVRLTPALELGASIKAIKEQLRAIPHKGLGFGVLRYLAGPHVAAAMAQLPPARVTFNYLGQFDSQFDPQALLRPALEAAGAETDPQALLANWLNLDGQVYGGELVVDWTFSERQFELAQVRTLAEAYASELRALVAHCANPGEQRLTPSDVPLAGLDQARLDALASSAGALEDLYPLSPMQQGMLFHSWMAPGNGDYINQLRLDVQGLDPLRFERAWQAALDAHGNLRASFHWPQGQGTPLQWVHRQVKLPFTVEPAQATYDENALNAIAQAQREAGFDLEQAPLLRLHLVPMGAARHHLIFTCHHLLLDGWSTSRLLGEVLQRYAGQPPAPVAGTYRDYIGWLQQRDQAASEAFWREQLARLDAPTRLARAFPAEQGSEAGQGELCLRLPKAASAGVQALARRCRVTANTVVQAAWALLLQRYTGQATVCFGATVAGRPGDLPGVQEQVGLFINTLPVIAQPRPEQALGAWLQRLQADNVALREHEHTPLYDIQRWAGQGGEALFDSLLVFENYPVAEALQQAPAGLSFGPVMAHEQTSYPLTAVVDLGAELVMRLGFSHAAFAPARIAELGEHWLQLLTAMSEAEQRPVGELCRLPGLARAALVDGFNATAV